MAFLSSGSSEGALAIFCFSVIGAALFVGLLLCSRRFDFEPGDDGDGRYWGGDEGPRPGDTPDPLAALEPPLGEIRVTRVRSAASRREPATPGSASD